MSEDKRKDTGKEESRNNANKSFGDELEDELTPISPGRIFNQRFGLSEKSASPESEKDKPESEKENQTTKGKEEGMETEQLEKEFEQLIDEYMPREEPVEVGDIMEVQVLDVRPDCILVDIGDKMEGMVDVSEFTNKKGEVSVSPGDTIEVIIEGRDEESEQFVLSHKKAARRLAVDRLRVAFEQKTPIKATVHKVVKGGLLVDAGLICFMPASHVDISRVENLEEWLGEEIDAFVIDFTMRGKRPRVVISRRNLLEEEQEKQKKVLFEKLNEGDVLTVNIKNVLDFGAFASLGPIDGFIPREEVSYEKGSHPGMFLKEGQEVKVKVIRVNPEEGKITLSRKQVMTDPWTVAAKKYPVDSTVKGRVVSIAPYGAFVQLEEGLTGMIHTSNLSWDKSPKSPKHFMKEGDVVEAVVLSIDLQEQRMALGLKQITEDPWIAVEGKYTPGKKVKGTVSGLTDFGAFVKLDENIEGMIHISNLTWDKNPQKPENYLKMGEEVEAVILNTNREGRRIALGLRQLHKSPLQKFVESHRVGSTVEGKVTRITDFGAFVEVAEGVEGLMHVSEISAERIDTPSSVLKEGENVKCKIINITGGGRRINLSRKKLIKDEEKAAMKEYLSTDVKGGQNVGDLLKDLDLDINK